MQSQNYKKLIDVRKARAATRISQSMTSHFRTIWIFRFLLSGMLSLVLCAPQFANAASVEVTSASVESSEDGYRMACAFNFEFTDGIRKALKDGLPISFIAEVDIMRPRWYWMDEKVVHSEHAMHIEYNEWTQQYSLTVNDGFKRSFSSLESVLALVMRPSRWLIADKNQLHVGANYNVAVRLKVSVSQMPKHFQIPAFNDKNLRQASDWR